MPDHTEEELASVLALVLNGRSLEEIVKAVFEVTCKVHGVTMWDLKRAVDKTLHVVEVYSMDPDWLRERIGEDWRDEPMRFKSHVTDEMLYNELDVMSIPDSISETMGYCMDELEQEFEKKGWLEPVPTEVEG